MASRKLDDLLPEVADMARDLIHRCAARGIKLLVTATYRSPEEQLALWMQGRADLAAVNAQRRAVGLAPITAQENARRVTKARPGQSLHEQRRAFDVVPLLDLDGDGDLDAQWRSPDWDTIGEQGERCGLEWGGRWPSPDRPHFQLKGS